jgi:uncharacterized protein (DUF1778 family)
MSALPKNSPKESLTIRIRPEDRGLIDLAANATGKNRTEFIIEAARRAAEETLLDRTFFVLGDDAYNKLLALLDAPPRPNEALRKLMYVSDPWDTSE